MQCRSHSRRRTSECLFVTACSMDQYGEEKRTEKNLIVRSGISEAETTNNKRLRSKFCIEAIQSRSIARPLRDSRATCFTAYSFGVGLWHSPRRLSFTPTVCRLSSVIVFQRGRRTTDATSNESRVDCWMLMNYACAFQKFFRRGLVENATYSCKLTGNCVINPRTRNACRYCRFQKCLESGMSRTGMSTDSIGRATKAAVAFSQ